MGDIIKEVYNFILVKTETNRYVDWKNTKDKPDDVADLKWYPWGKELPEDIDTVDYKYIDGKLVKG